MPLPSLPPLPDIRGKSREGRSRSTALRKPATRARTNVPLRRWARRYRPGASGAIRPEGWMTADRRQLDQSPREFTHRLIVRMSMRVAVAMLLAMRMGMAGVGAVRVNHRMARLRRPRYLFFEPLHNAVESHLAPQIREHKRPLSAHFFRIALHHFQRRAHIGSQVYLINHQQVGPHDAGTALARNFVALGHVNHVNPDVHQLRAERRRQIIAAALDENQFEPRKR